MKRTPYLFATADPDRASEGVAVVASYQDMPATHRPFKVRGINLTPKTRRVVEIALTRAEAEKLVADFVSLGGFNV